MLFLDIHLSIGIPDVTILILEGPKSAFAMNTESVEQGLSAVSEMPVERVRGIAYIFLAVHSGVFIAPAGRAESNHSASFSPTLAEAIISATAFLPFSNISLASSSAASLFISSCSSETTA